MNEQQSLHDSQYKLFVGAFSNYDGENTKKSVSLPDNEVQNFLEGEENQYTKRKPKVAYSVALVLAFLLAENENRQLEDLPLADLGRLPHSLVSYRVTYSKRNFISARPCILLYSFATVPTMRKMLRVTLRPLLRAPLENTSASGVPSLYVIIVIIIIILFITIIFLWSLFELSVLLGYYS